jgi:hypothetical protein
MLSDCAELAAHMEHNTGSVEIFNGESIDRIFFPIPSSIGQLPNETRLEMNEKLYDISRTTPEQKSAEFAGRVKQVSSYLTDILECSADPRRRWTVMYTNEFRRISFYITMIILFLVYLFYGQFEKPWEEYRVADKVVFALGLLHCFLTFLRCVAHLILHRKLETNPDVGSAFSTPSDATKTKADKRAEAELDLILAYLRDSGESMSELMWKLDTSGDGQLDAQELVHGLRKLGINLPSFDSIMHVFDPDGPSPRFLRMPLLCSSLRTEPTTWLAVTPRLVR